VCGEPSPPSARLLPQASVRLRTALKQSLLQAEQKKNKMRS
jgi:hypothetical protein